MLHFSHAIARSTLLPLLLLVSGLSGCAQTTLVRHWQPASIDVEGLDRVVIADFDGENASAVTSVLDARLHSGRFYTLVDAAGLTPVQHASFAPCRAESAILKVAAEARVDAVISGSVVEYRCEDTILRQTDFDAHEGESDGEQPGHHFHVGFRQQDRVRREGTVTIAFRMTDSRTGELRAAHTASHHYSGESGPGEPALPPRGEVLEKLVGDCVEEFVQMTTPHEVEVPVRLAQPRLLQRHGGGVRSGNKLALQGKWDAARDQWEAVIAEQPECDTALYNLAVDAARRRDYDAAEELAMQALQHKHNDRYVDGLEQIRQQRASYDDARRQRDQRSTQVASSW
ncbi:MAG: tetratricopeptide repeat protein [Planctomycetaceae bacterium]